MTSNWGSSRRRGLPSAMTLWPLSRAATGTIVGSSHLLRLLATPSSRTALSSILPRDTNNGFSAGSSPSAVNRTHDSATVPPQVESITPTGTCCFCSISRAKYQATAENSFAVSGVDALHRLDDVLAALLDVVVGADGDGLDLALRADDVLQRSAELDGESTVGDEDKTNHRQGIPAGAVAPHERAAIIIIQSPSSRAPSPIVVGCCIAVNGPSRWFPRHAVSRLYGVF